MPPLLGGAAGGESSAADGAPERTDAPPRQVQVFNRDISVLVLGLFAQWRYVEKAEKRARKEAAQAGRDGKAAAAEEKERLYALTAGELDELVRRDGKTSGLRVLDALAATALRSVRYAKEVPGVRAVVANDVDDVHHDYDGEDVWGFNGLQLRCGQHRAQRQCVHVPI